LLASGADSVQFLEVRGQQQGLMSLVSGTPCRGFQHSAVCHCYQQSTTAAQHCRPCGGGSRAGLCWQHQCRPHSLKQREPRMHEGSTQALSLHVAPLQGPASRRPY
jgi:hypothetical protein